MGGGCLVESFTSAYQQAQNERVSKAPLLDRGWVFQERILPPRTIYFGAQGVHFECRTSHINDGHCIFQDQVPKNGKIFFDNLLSAQQSQEYHKGNWSVGSITRSGNSDQTNQNKASNADGLSTRQSNLDTENGETPATKPLEIDPPEPIRATGENFASLDLGWSVIVDIYSTKGFTNHEDKLIALQGLIDIIVARNGLLTPYFGMWKELLFDELLWEVVQPGHRLEKSIAPSFSWASVESPIRRLYLGGYEDSARRCSILAATAVDSSLDGAPRRGVITMSGKCQHCHVPGNTASIELTKESSRAKQRGHIITIKLDSIADTQQELIHMHFLVMICLTEDSYTHCGQGLILRPATMPDSELGQTDNLYERIGVFQWKFSAKDVAWWDEVDETTGAPYSPEEVLNII